MVYQISISDQDRDILIQAAERNEKQIEQMLHETIQRLQSSSHIIHSMTLHELVEKQYCEGKFSHILTRNSLIEEEREVFKRSAYWFVGGKPVSEIVIEDRGPY